MLLANWQKLAHKMCRYPSRFMFITHTNSSEALDVRDASYPSQREPRCVSFINTPAVASVHPIIHHHSHDVHVQTCWLSFGVFLITVPQAEESYKKKSHHFQLLTFSAFDVRCHSEVTVKGTCRDRFFSKVQHTETTTEAGVSEQV